MIYNLGLYPYLSDTPKLDHLGIHGEWNNYKKKINFIYAGKKLVKSINLILFSIYKGEAKNLREID